MVNPSAPRLTNNLFINLRIKAGIVVLLISRSSVYPSPTEWTTILRHWPYPVSCKPEKIIRKQPDGQCRHYLRGQWLLQANLGLETSRTDRQPINIYSGNVIN